MDKSMLDRLKEKMEDPEFQKSTDDFFRKVHDKDIRHKKYYKIFTPEIIDRIYEKHGTKAYHSKNMEKMMNVMWDCAKEKGYEAPEHIADRIGGDFTSGMYILNDRIFELISGQGSFISISKLTHDDILLTDIIKLVYRYNGYNLVDISGIETYINYTTNEFVTSFDYNDLPWEFIINTVKRLGGVIISTNKYKAVLDISDYINNNKKDEVKK